MKEFVVRTLDTEPTFNVPETDPNYHMLRWCHEQSLNLWEMRQEGFVVQQPQNSDFIDLEIAFDGSADNIAAWLGSAMTASAAGDEIPAVDENLIPDVITFAALLATQNWGAIFLLFVKVGLKTVINFAREKLNPDAQTGDVSELLKDLFGVTDDNGEIVGCKLEGLSNLQVQINNLISQGESTALYSAKAMQE